MIVWRLLLQNTGVVTLDYDWHITMTDQQSAMAIMTGAPMPTVVAPPPPSTPTVPTPVPSKTIAGSSAMAVGSALRPIDQLRPDGVSPRSDAISPRSGTVSSRYTGTPAIIEEEESPLPAHLAAEAAPIPPAVLPTTSVSGTENMDEASYIPFSVTPASGQIAAGSSAEILVKFLPLDVYEYFACLTARYWTYMHVLTSVFCNPYKLKSFHLSCVPNWQYVTRINIALKLSYSEV